MRRIGVVTTSRADYGIYRPVLDRIRDDPEVELHLLVSGSHLVPHLGDTVREIERDGFEPAARIEVLVEGDSPQATAKSIGLGVIGFAQTLAACRPDLLVVLGDRFEMAAAALAALPLRVPVAHLHGGEVTLGVTDESLRHAMTKLSHLHFVAAPEYGARVVQMGEEPWRVTVCGAPSLDVLRHFVAPSRPELEAQLGCSLPERFMLVTYHPATLELADPALQARELVTAVEAADLAPVFTGTNADPGGFAVREVLTRFVLDHPEARYVESAGALGYAGLMSHAALMLGNSSSGIIEAATFGLPVVNVGTRQAGRVRSDNVIDVPCERDAIVAAVARAESPGHRAVAASATNLYDRGGAAARIVDRLRSVAIDETLLIKRFHDDAG